jgi:type I restriction enzyme M protein
MLRLNLILNNLVHSFPNVVQGNTLLEPAHRDKTGLKKFDYVVSNPPFKLDFSDFRDDLDKPVNSERFFAGIPAVKKKDKDKMPIYLLFLQHILFSLSKNGKAAVVVPTGFLTEKNGIAPVIRKKIVDNKSLVGVVAMPPNIFATTGTNVSILFLDMVQLNSDIFLLDASTLGETVKEGKNQKTILGIEEENLIIESFLQKKEVAEFSIKVDIEEIQANRYSLNPGQYFVIDVEDNDKSELNIRLLSKKYSIALTHFEKANKEINKKILSTISRSTNGED